MSVFVRFRHKNRIEDAAEPVHTVRNRQLNGTGEQSEEKKEMRERETSQGVDEIAEGGVRYTNTLSSFINSQNSR